MPLHTSINGKPAKWNHLIWAMWRDVEPVEYEVIRVNYFTPRPHRHEYDRGNPDEGFVWTTKQGGVYETLVNTEEESD